MKGKILLLAAIMFIPSNLAFATLGPVHVELNMWKPRLSASRANSLTAFKICFRYNTNIKINEWLKIWLPIYESGLPENPVEIPTKICDGLGGIDERPGARFVPNEEYFKKFDNAELKKLRQIYEGKDEKGGYNFSLCPDVSKIENWGNACQKDQGRFRFVKDPSGLGCWKLGTVMPSIPIDSAERMEVLKKIMRGISLGYSPCAECQGYAIIINNCKERSYQENAPLEVEAWRKGYNSIDWNISKSSGFIAPATPGRYRIAVATKPEPEPVESEAFVLPCSDVSNVEFRDSISARENVRFSMNFSTGEGGALDGGSSTIMLRLPKNFVLPKKFPAKSIVINGSYVTSKPQIAADQLTLVVPTDIPNLGKTEIAFLDNSGVTINNTNESSTFEVSTSSEPNFIKSNPIKPNSTPFTSVVPNTELTNSWIRARCVLDENEEITKGSQIKVNFPEGFSIPQKIDSKNVYVNDLVLATPVVIENNTITINSPTAIKVALTITFLKGSGLMNPSVGKYKITIDTDGKVRDCGEFETIPFEGSISSVELSESRATLPTKVKIDFTPSSRRMLEPGDTVTVIFPAGSTIPSEFDKQMITINKQAVLDAAANGIELVLKTPVKISVYEKTTIIIDIGIVNPKRSDSYMIAISTSRGDWFESKPYRIESGPLTTSIVFADPDKPACDLWFNRPPLLSFECPRDGVKTYYQFDNGMDKTLFESAIRMPYTNESKTIYFYSIDYGEKENLQKYEYGLDVTPPKFNILSPKEELVYTSTPYFDIEVERIPQDFFNHGIANTHRIADELFILVNGEKTPVFEGQMYQISKEGEIQFKAKQRIKLPIEGENVVEFVSRDFACNETVVKRTIIKDTKAPDIEILEPKFEKVFVDGDEILFKVRTQSGSSVTINGIKMNVESDDGKYAVYSCKIKVSFDETIFKIAIIDPARNPSVAIFVLDIRLKKAIIKLTIDDNEWTVNDVKQPPLKSPPTMTFKEPAYKALNGTTYMPISDVAKYLACSVTWDPGSRTITLIQKPVNGGTKTIVMQIGKTTATIDGIEKKFNSKGTLFPVSLKEKTLLPLRFVAENLGAEVTYDPMVKSITIVYPKGG